jgi:hypothetical protein
MKLLVISPVPPEPPTAGNRARIFNLIAHLEQLAHDVTFAYVPYEPADYEAMERRLGHRLHVLRSEGLYHNTFAGRPKRKILRALNLRSAHSWGVDDWFDDKLLAQARVLQNRRSFDFILVEYVYLSKLAPAFPHSVRTIIDTHDLMGDRRKIYLQRRFCEIQVGVPDCELAIARPASEGGTWPDSVLALGQMKSLASLCSGQALKTIEALNHGKPLVATTAGVRGLGRQFVNTCVVAQSASEFAQRIIGLLQSKAARARLSENALAAARAWRLQQLAALDAAVKRDRRSKPVSSQ